MSGLEIFIYGILGGVIPELLAMYRLRHHKKGNRPDWLKSGFYWIVTIVMILVGGGTAFLYHKLGINVNELMAIHLGAATPIIISSVGKSKPDVS